MSLQTQCMNLFDLPLSKAMIEAHNKLQGSYVYLNGYIRLVKRINHTSIEFGADKLRICENTEVLSLKVFLPETGVYFNRDSVPIILYKKPLRQWCPSFKAENYQIHFPESRTDDITSIDVTNRKEVWVDRDAIIRYYSSRIGHVSTEDTVVCTNLYFSQELKDWMKNG